MTLYRFRLDLPLSVPETLTRIQALARERPELKQYLKESFGGRAAGTPPFIGQVTGDDFTLSRDIRYRNSFLPRIRGHVSASPVGGATVDVAMSLHPVIVAFIVVWFGFLGPITVAVLRHGKPPESLIPLGMCVFLVLLAAAGFYPEAIKARRILETTLQEGSVVDAGDAGHRGNR